MSSEGQDRAHALGWGGLRSPRMYALIRAKVHLGAAVEDVANVRHGDAPFVHPPVAVADRSNLHGIMIGGRDTPKDVLPRWCYSPRCLILCAVVTLMCSRARGGRSSITRWSSASVSRRSTHSSAYCASLASPISSICPSLSSIALLWLGAGVSFGCPGPLLARPTSQNLPSTHSSEYQALG